MRDGFWAKTKKYLTRARKPLMNSLTLFLPSYMAQWNLYIDQNGFVINKLLIKKRNFKITLLAKFLNDIFLAAFWFYATKIIFLQPNKRI